MRGAQQARFVRHRFAEVAASERKRVQVQAWYINLCAFSRRECRHVCQVVPRHLHVAALCLCSVLRSIARAPRGVGRMPRAPNASRL